MLLSVAVAAREGQLLAGVVLAVMGANPVVVAAVVELPQQVQTPVLAVLAVSKM
jgi:hypothetical protein